MLLLAEPFLIFIVRLTITYHGLYNNNLHDKAIHKQCDNVNITMSVGVISMIFQSKINNSLLSRILVYYFLLANSTKLYQMPSETISKWAINTYFYFLISQ